MEKLKTSSAEQGRKLYFYLSKGKLFYIWVLGIMGSGLIWGQPQRLPVKKIFLFPGNIALVYREGKVQLNNGKASLENLENTLYNKYWMAPVGPFNITRLVTGVDTVYHKVQALNFFDMLRANVGAQTEVTYKIGDELEGAIGEILPIAPGSELAMIKQSDGSTVIIKKSQIEQVAIKGVANAYFMEPRLESATFVETDSPLETVHLQQFYFTNQIRWLASYNLKLLTDSTANLSMKSTIDNLYENYEQIEIHFCIGAPAFVSGNTIEDCALELISKLPLGGLSPSIHSIVHGFLTPEAQATQERFTRETFMPGSFASLLREGVIEIWDKQTLTIKKNSKSYITNFSEEIGYNLVYSASLPNNWDTTRYVIENTEPQTLGMLKKINFLNTTQKDLLPAPVTILDATEAPIARSEVKYCKKGFEVIFELGNSNDVEIKSIEMVTKMQPKFKKNEKDKISYDKYFLTANLQVKNWTTTKVKVFWDKIIVGEFRMPGFKVDVLQKGLNHLYKVNWSGTLEPGATRTFKIDYFYYKPLP